jgi:hypothetical protein
VLNEDAYHSARKDATPLPCAFEKAVLSRCCDCSMAERHNLAEREAAGCRSAVASQNCKTLRGLFKQNAMFVLKITHPGEALPHAKELKTQCGGMIGLQTQLDGTEPVIVSDIHDVVVRAQKQYGSLQEIPFGEIVKWIGAFEARRRK